MDVTTQRRCLGAIAGGLFLGTAGAIVWSLSGIDALDVVAPPGQQVQPADVGKTESRPSEDRITLQSLRGPLYDPTPPPPRRQPPPPPPKQAPAPAQQTLQVTLVGTIIESDQSLAILADASGKFDIKGIGEALELVPQGMTVRNIEAEQVTLHYQGRQSTLQLDRSLKKKDRSKRENERRRNNR